MTDRPIPAVGGFPYTKRTVFQAWRLCPPEAPNAYADRLFDLDRLSRTRQLRPGESRELQDILRLVWSFK